MKSSLSWARIWFLNANFPPSCLNIECHSFPFGAFSLPPIKRHSFLVSVLISLLFESLSCIRCVKREKKESTMVRSILVRKSDEYVQVSKYEKKKFRMKKGESKEGKKRPSISEFGFWFLPFRGENLLFRATVVSAVVLALPGKIVKIQPDLDIPTIFMYFYTVKKLGKLRWNYVDLWGSKMYCIPYNFLVFSGSRVL